MSRTYKTISIALFIIAALAACDAPDDTLPVALPQSLPTRSTLSPSVGTPTPIVIPSPVTIYERYTVRFGDTLSGISARLDVSLDDLRKTNGIENADTLKIGQVLKYPVVISLVAPSDLILPDSELPYSPAYATFDVTAFANQSNGYLASYREKVEGDMLTGPQIIQLVAERFSVGPRVLLALLEMQSGWVTKSQITNNQITYPMGMIDSTRQGLFFQAGWAANHLNEGYYGKLSGRLAAYRLKDRIRVRLSPTINPGSAAIQNVLALLYPWETWQNQIGSNGFIATYKSLFGEPGNYAIESLVPRDLRQPALRLPWSDGAMWYYTGGPHDGWGDAAGAFSAVDFTPRDILGSCYTSADWVLAAAPGKILRAERGRVIQSLSNSNFQGSGWTLLYMHIATTGRVAAGAQINLSDRIGHPSCEGGTSNASHVHLARLYNGQWISADSIPFLLSGWRIIAQDQEYEGKMMRGSESREACSCRDDAKNGVVADGGR